MTDNQTKSPRSEAPLVPLFHTILATQNKTSELFVKSFQYQGENIATKHLGQIFGFFEIPDTQEDNAYIVNFLASVVKKEYFVNPKRSATDSFEATLHKINLALTELVKQGNTAWLGNLHGVVSVIINNTFHFSVTGDASILLYRDNQVTCISEGLADKDAALHPLKTFLEISSGALLADDKILLASPELFTLCEPETLRKHAFRMDKNGFARYVRAALVNELPLGVSLIIDMEPEKSTAAPKKKAKELREESLEKLQNVFSGTSFSKNDPGVALEESEPEEMPSEEALVPSEYTDQKTGHIYVQGEMTHTSFKEPSFWQTFSEERLRPLWKSALMLLKRFSKKSRKTVAKQASVLGVEGKQLGSALWKTSREKSRLLAQKGSSAFKESIAALNKKTSKKEPSLFENQEEEPYFSGLSTEENKDADLVFEIPDLPSQEGTPDAEKLEEPVNSRQKALHKFSPLYERSQKNHPRANGAEGSSLFVSLLAGIYKNFFSFLKSIYARLKNLSLKQKLFAGICILLIILVIFLILRSPQDEEMPAPSESVSDIEESAPPEEETPHLSNPVTQASWTEGSGLLVAKTDTGTIVVTPKSILLNDKAFTFPADGTIESATYMADLRLVFLWSNKRELVSWSVVDQKFSANTLPLPANATVGALGSYLTYLYVLDKNAGAIYRFARTEGGFGEPTSWLKTPFAKDSVQAFAVTDTIRIANDTTLDQYFKGAKEKTLADKHYEVLGLSSEKNFTLGLEQATGRLAIWNTDGSSVYEETFEELKGASALSYNEGDKKLLVTKGQNLIEYPLSW